MRKNSIRCGCALAKKTSTPSAFSRSSSWIRIEIVSDDSGPWTHLFPWRKNPANSWWPLFYAFHLSCFIWIATHSSHRATLHEIVRQTFKSRFNNASITQNTPNDIHGCCGGGNHFGGCCHWNACHFNLAMLRHLFASLSGCPCISFPVRAWPCSLLLATLDLFSSFFPSTSRFSLASLQGGSLSLCPSLSSLSVSSLALWPHFSHCVHLVWIYR